MISEATSQHNLYDYDRIRSRAAAAHTMCRTPSDDTTAVRCLAVEIVRVIVCGEQMFYYSRDREASFRSAIWPAMRLSIPPIVALLASADVDPARSAVMPLTPCEIALVPAESPVGGGRGDRRPARACHNERALTRLRAHR